MTSVQERTAVRIVEPCRCCGTRPDGGGHIQHVPGCRLALAQPARVGYRSEEDPAAGVPYPGSVIAGRLDAVLALTAAGKTMAEIVAAVGVSRSTLCRDLRMLRATGRLTPRPEPSAVCGSCRAPQDPDRGPLHEPSCPRAAQIDRINGASSGLGGRWTR